MAVAEDRERLKRIVGLLTIARHMRDWEWFDRLTVEYQEALKDES